MSKDNRELLVVEGHLAIGAMTTLVLSKSGGLQDPIPRTPEANAKVIVEGDDGTMILGVSNENGACVLNTVNLDAAKKYRVKIIRANTKAYETDFLECVITPEIDSLDFKVDGSGFQINVSTHDSGNRTRYYLWEYIETWELRTRLPSFWEVKNGRIVQRDQNINISRCWQENASSRILVTSTERLSEDKVSNFPLAFVEGRSDKLSELYSVLVRQYGLNQDAFQYMETMKKNTEEIGTIFDPQPSELRGNIKCVSNPGEQVLGWISAGSISEKRLFISARDKPQNWVYPDDCSVSTIHIDSLLRFVSNGYLINQKEYFPNPWPYASPPPAPWKPGDTIFTVAQGKCIDCRLRGTNVKPSFWLN